MYYVHTTSFFRYNERKGWENNVPKSYWGKVECLKVVGEKTKTKKNKNKTKTKTKTKTKKKTKKTKKKQQQQQKTLGVCNNSTG